ncbi:MAG: hypothetical protein A2Z17_04740 [Gammaproteobacteria bacterium RBG_16_66_13]|nr:MAG: hypothetical protein A2Z17_04740 [Gammaproteobacteria bacterium RBG_16_66_13]
MLAALRLVGQVLGRSVEAEQNVAGLEQLVAHLQDQLPPERPTVLILNGTPADFFVAKPESCVGNLVPCSAVRM